MLTPQNVKCVFMIRTASVRRLFAAFNKHWKRLEPNGRKNFAHQFGHILPFPAKPTPDLILRSEVSAPEHTPRE